MDFMFQLTLLLLLYPAFWESQDWWPWQPSNTLFSEDKLTVYISLSFFLKKGLTKWRKSFNIVKVVRNDVINFLKVVDISN